MKTKPSQIVMETLNVTGMMKNRHLAKAVAQQKLYEFKRQIQYKCRKYGITFVEADRWYPSSKKCSCCGNIKKNLKLSDRIYYCDNCGLKIDRDFNASVNLANYRKHALRTFYCHGIISSYKVTENDNTNRTYRY